MVTGALVTLTGPADQTAVANDGECSATVNNIDPVVDPPNINETVNYTLYGATTGSGTGSISGMQFTIGVTTVVYSLASNPLQRAVFSVTVTGGTLGGALDFDGVDDRVDVGGSMYPIGYGHYGEYSFEAWIKPRTYNSEGSLIFGNERNGNGGIRVQLDANGYISTYQQSVGSVVSSYKVSLDTWTHIAFVQSTAKLDLYVNGDFVQTLLTAPNLHFETYYGDYLLGAYTNDFVSYSSYFNGEMDEVRVWDKAICPAQILNNLHCEISGYDYDLTAYYKFNQGIASCNNPDVTNLYGDPGYGTLSNFALNGPTSNWVTGFITGSCAPFNSLVLYCPDPVTVNAEPGQCSAIVNFSATATSGCSQDVTITYSQNPGTSFPTGTTYVNITATDDFGNTQYCSFPVTVKDAQAPVLVTKNITLPLNSYGSVYFYYNDVIESVTDDCDPYPYTSVYPTYFSCSNVGDNTVTVTATDVSGNTTTKTAIVTITPFVTSSTIEITPSTQQYSDVATFKASILGAGSYYYSGCSPATEVTFKLGTEDIGTVSLYPDYYYGNLVGTLDKQLLGLSSKKITAIFSGGTSNAVSFNKKAITYLTPAKENAGIEYVESQLINSATTEVTIPVAALITDTSDGYRGDIRNATVTLTITPVTSGASIIGDNTINVSTLSFVNNDHTSGVAKGSFKVSTGINNSLAKFNITIKVNGYYTAGLKVPVTVKRTAGNIAVVEDIPLSSITKQGPGTMNFDITALPNPSHDYYSLKVQSSDKYSKINVRILDITGRVIQTWSNVNVGDIIKAGHAYLPGTYLAEITQGQNKKVIKLIKL